MGCMSTPRHDPEEIRHLLDLRQSARLTFKQLSEQSGVPVHVLTYRAGRDRREGESSAAEPCAFVEVVATPSAIGAHESSGIRLVLPGELRVQLDRDFDEATLARLLSVAGC